MGWKSVFKKAKPYIAIISLQFGYSVMIIISAICLKDGMNHYVLSVYRAGFAFLAMAPFALIFERKTRPKMTLSILWKVMVLGFLEPVLDSNLYYAGLKYTSATFSATIVNTLPAISFIMATIFRLEKVEISKIPSQAKIIGTIMTVSGAMVMTIYRGPVVNLFGAHGPVHKATTTSTASAPHHWVAGTLLVLGCCLGWAAFLILQSYTLKEYPAQLSLAAWICFIGAAQGAAVSLAIVRDLKAWALGWDSRLLASVYNGVVCSGIAYYVQGIVNRKKGPVFATIFNPLALIMTAALGSIILHEVLHLGSIIGAVIIVTGLYTVVWGKSKDQPSEKGKAEELPIVNDGTTTTTTTAAAATNKLADINKSDGGFPSGISMIRTSPPSFSPTSSSAQPCQPE